MPEPGSLLLVYKASDIFRLTISNAILLIISSISIVANSINGVIFFRQGFQESVNLTFFTLSISDLGISVCCCLMSLTAWADRLYAGFVVDPSSLLLAIFAPMTFMFYVISTFAATYLSVERCVCVVFPLQVKRIFTRKLRSAAMCIITLWGVVNVIPYFSTQELRWSFDPQYNKTRLLRWTTETRVYARTFTKFFIQGIQPITAQVIISVCAGTLIGKLKLSSTFRNNTNSQPNVNITRMKKEAKLIKMVISVAVIFILCNFPQCIVTIARFVVPSIDVVDQKNDDLLFLVFELCFCFMSINASVNAIAYYRCSSIYRRMFKSMFTWKSQRNEEQTTVESE